jgi:hypothetical protein
MRTSRHTRELSAAAGRSLRYRLFSTSARLQSKGSPGHERRPPRAHHRTPPPDLRGCFFSWDDDAVCVCANDRHGALSPALERRSRRREALQWWRRFPLPRGFP